MLSYADYQADAKAIYYYGQRVPHRLYRLCSKKLKENLYVH
jgi:hypothetical protein